MKLPAFLINEYRKKLYNTKSLPQDICTVCEEAKCPNRGECFSKGRVTFLLLGDTCTRNCGFCGIKKAKAGLPLPPDDAPKIIDTIKRFNIKYLVLTSVTRDDLPDGGASVFADVIDKVRQVYPEVKIEVLTPDFKGDTVAIDAVLVKKPYVFNHNLETVRSGFQQIRPEGNFDVSLKLLEYAKKKNPSILVKTGIMVGVGETKEQVLELIKTVQEKGIDIMTIGQYLAPSKKSFEVKRYVELEEYEEYIALGKSIGLQIIAGPLVRSSYMADTYSVSK
ncbi:MAG: lipoyl synthase [Candidatus Margulisbacteria bacterium]|nr:lipoyl synthase [Candidatus Margulisiibacteriota bacterium]